MEQIGKLIQTEPSLTDLEAKVLAPLEDYILTPEEENSVIGNAKRTFLEKKAVTMQQLGVSPNHLEEELSKYDLTQIFTEENVCELLRTANSNKHQALWHKEQSKKRIQADRERLADLVRKCNSKYFYRLMKGFKLIENDNTLPYIKTLCFFFGNDERFQTELSFDFSKGLWIRGNAGIGKTYLLDCISQNDLVPFEIHSMIEIASQVKDNGEYLIKDRMIVIDDAGSEEAVVNHYGTKINWLKEFIELYYAEKRPFSRLIVTTNCSFDEIQEKYGFRVRSRIKDMFNVVDVKGEDLRGK